MPFQIQCQAQVHSPQPDVTFTLADNGGAHVDMTLSILGRPPIVNQFTYHGAVKTTMTLPSGQYQCLLLVKAFVYGAMAPTYDSVLAINGNPVAHAKGVIPASPGHDFGYAQFALTV